MARMIARIRVLFGFFFLCMRVSRTFFAMNAFLGLGLPLIIQFVFGSMIAEEDRVRLLIGNGLFAGMMVALRKPAIEFIANQQFGQRDLLASTLVSREIYIGGYFLDTLALAMFPLTFLAIGSQLPGVSPPVSLAFVVPYVVVISAFYGLTLCIGSIAVTLPTAVLLTNLLSMFALALCPLMYPMERVPDLIREVVQIMPPSLAAELMASHWAGIEVGVWQMPMLIAWALAALGLGAARFPWTD